MAKWELPEDTGDRLEQAARVAHEVNRAYCQAIGESNVIDPANYNEVLGKQIALKDAKEKIWQLEGYAMKTRG